MTRKIVTHAVILIIATLVIYSWVTNPVLANYSLQLTGILLLTLIFTHHLLKPVTFKLVESTISTMSVLMVISATGGLSSPLFFLNYFLLFELSLLLEPVIPMLLAGALIVFYIASDHTTYSSLTIIELLAFPIMTPLAFFFGQMYQKVKNQKKEIQHLEKEVEELTEELVEEEVGTSV